MYLKRLNLKNFRNYRYGSAGLSPGTNIIIGDNGAGKTNVLEAVQYGCCGRSFRTSREAEMVAWESQFLRVEALFERESTSVTRAVVFEEGDGARVNAGGGPKWLEAGSVLCFSPDDLQLIKGPPSGRRRFLDDAVTRRRPAHARLCLDYQKVLAQRNSFLQRARGGLVKLADILPWDRQLASLALRVSMARSRYCGELNPHFENAHETITGSGARPVIRYRSQLETIWEDDEPEAALGGLLQEGWLQDLGRRGTGTGSHRDNFEILLDGKDLRVYGSQGEQRAAVLALLLADCAFACEQGGVQPLLLLDDVMGELDYERRRRLMELLAARRAQAIITAADRDYFSAAELDGAEVIEVRAGQVFQSRMETGV